jgi:enterochelin esterase-like enzyme
MKKALFPLLAFAAACAASAESPWREPVRFSITNDAGVGYSWFVVGSHPDLGEWNSLRAVPLAWHEGNVWSADVGIKAGTELPSTETTGYKFVKRPTNAADYPDDTNTEWESGDNHSLSVTADADSPHPGKRVVLLWDCPEPVELWYSLLSKPEYDAAIGWTNVTMKKTAEGRYELDGVGEAGEWMQFTFCHPLEGEDDPGKWWWYHFRPTDGEETDFWTPLDAFCVRDAQVFDYEPVPTAEGWVSGSRIVSTNVNSTAANIDGREIRIYLPRGYDENTSRRYPVVYFADGQNVFQPGGTYGCWNAETAADREIRAGHMREAILVAVPCRTNDISGMPGTSEFARLWEYLPSTDTLVTTELQGLGEKYADFLINNVKPTLDYNFRTLRDRENTAHIGSSAGGLLSLYLGTAYGDVFGLVAPMSGVYNEEYIPNFRQWCLEHPEAVAKPKRIWLDTGTEETAVGADKMMLNLYESNWDALTLLLYAGHVHNKSLHFGVYSGWQGEHNEPAWADRIADVYRFLLPVTDEFNPLIPRELRLDGSSVVCPLYPGETARLVGVPSLTGARTTNEVAVFPPTDRPWTTGVQPVPLDSTAFYWLEVQGP